MPIDFNCIGGSTAGRYLQRNAQRSINWYPVVSSQTEQSKTPTALYSRPGLLRYVSIPGGIYNRGIFTAKTDSAAERCFTVVDTTLYEITTFGTVINRGALTSFSNGSSPIYMIVNGASPNQLGIFSYSGAYSLNLTTNVLTAVGGLYPGTVDYADYLDGYAWVTSGGESWYGNVNDMITWPGFVIDATFKADGAKATLAFNQEIYVFGQDTIEIYLQSGSTPAWTRQFRSSFLIGLVATNSVAVFDDGFLFLGRSGATDAYGDPKVYYFRLGWQNPVEVSQDIDWDFKSNKARVKEAQAYIQNMPHGMIYRLTIPGLDTTYEYNLNNNMWSEARSYNPVPDSNGQKQLGPFRGQYYTNFQGMNLFTDRYSGNILMESYNTFTEDGEVLKRRRRTQIFSAKGQLITINKGEFDVNMGYSNVGAESFVYVSISYDGAITFSNQMQVSLGNLGDYLNRALLSNLGAGYNIAVDIEYTDNADLMLQDFFINGEIAEH